MCQGIEKRKNSNSIKIFKAFFEVGYGLCYICLLTTSIVLSAYLEQGMMNEPNEMIVCDQIACNEPVA